MTISIDNTDHTAKGEDSRIQVLTDAVNAMQAATTGAGFIQRAIVTLTDAQIKALPTTPVTILAAPGAGKVNFPFLIFSHMSWHGDYTNIHAQAILSWGEADIMGELVNDPGGFVTQFFGQAGPDGIFSISAPTQRIIGSVIDTTADGQTAGDTGWYDSDILNKALILSIQNGDSGNFTGGDPANTLKVTVFYVVVDS